MHLNSSRSMKVRIDTKTIADFRAVLRRFERLSQQHLRACCRQVTVAQCHLLLAIDAVGEATATNLADRLDLDISTVSRTVSTLVTRGLLARDTQLRDRRQTRLALTDKGRRACADINRDADRFCAEVLARIPAKRRAAVMESFVVLVDAFASCQEHESTCGGDTKCGTSGCRS